MRPPPPTRPAPGGDRAAAALAEATRLRATGRMAEALRPARLASQLLPDSPTVFFDLGLNYLQTGQIGEAIASLERALALRPRYAEAAWQLGVARYAAGDLEGALADLSDATLIKPSLAEGRYWLATLLQQLGRTDEAIAAFRKTRSVAGTTGPGWLAEARALWLLGDDPGVERAARRAASVDPKNADAQAMLGGVHADAGRFGEAADCYQRALDLNPRLIRFWYDLTRCRRMTEADRPLLARMQGALQQPGAEAATLAMLFLAVGKTFDDLRARRLKFDSAQWRRTTERTVAKFSPERLAASAGWGSPDETPVLILGMPRSGTTLVEQMISAHPEVAGAGELGFWAQRASLVDAVGEEGPDATFVASAAADYLAHIRPLGPTAARITDKAPFNVFWAGLIHLAFPKATIIHCCRRPIDTALSIHQTWFSEALNLPTGGAALVAYYREYERVAAHWRRVLPPGCFVEVDYEGLITDPEPHMRRLITAIGLAWDDACLHPERNERIVKTASRWQVRQPIYRSAVDRWRLYEPYLGPLAALLEDTPKGPVIAKRAKEKGPHRSDP